VALICRFLKLNIIFSKQLDTYCRERVGRMNKEGRE